MKSEWKMMPLQDFVEFNPKEVLKKGAFAKKVPMEALTPFQRQIAHCEKAFYQGGTKFRNGDTIMARITPCLENGKVAFVSIFDADEVGFGSTEYVVFRAKEGISDAMFVYYLVRSDVVRLPAIKSMVGSSGRQRVQEDVLRKLDLNLPSLPTQRKIAAILSSLDDKIENNNAICKNLEEQAAALYKSWFVDFEPFGGKKPQSWKYCRLDTFTEIKRGSSPRPINDYIANEGLRWLKISDVTSVASPFIHHIKEHIKKTGLSRTVFLQAGSLVLSNSATPGIPKILDVDTCIHDGWLYFPNSSLSNEFLYLLFKQIRPKLICLGNGSVFTNLKTEILKSYEVLIPDSATLLKFDSLIHDIFKAILNRSRENQHLATIRETILPKLMSGEVEVDKVAI